MDAVPLTYKNLFALLVSLGFREAPPSKDGNEPLVFVHAATDTVLLFRDAPDETVTPADILSTEVHLHANNIVDQSLESLLSAISMRDAWSLPVFG